MPQKPPLHPLVKLSGQFKPQTLAHQFPEADFTKPAGYVVFGPKPKPDGAIYQIVEDWINDIFNLFNATFGKWLLVLTMFKKVAKLFNFLILLLFYPQVQDAVRSYTSQKGYGYPFYFPKGKKVKIIEKKLS